MKIIMCYGNVVSVFSIPYVISGNIYQKISRIPPPSPLLEANCNHAIWTWVTHRRHPLPYGSVSPLWETVRK